MDKLSLVQLYRDNYGGKLEVKLFCSFIHNTRSLFLVSLSFKVVKRLTVLQLEMAFRMQLLEKRISDAILSI